MFFPLCEVFFASFCRNFTTYPKSIYKPHSIYTENPLFFKADHGCIEHLILPVKAAGAVIF